VEVAGGTFDPPDSLTGEFRLFFTQLPTPAQKAFLSVYENGSDYPEGPPTEEDLIIGSFLYENAGSASALATGRAYAEHPAEVAAFTGIAVETYALAPVELANADPDFMPDALGRGQFTWEGVFGWIEDTDFFGQQPDPDPDRLLDDVYVGMAKVVEYTFGTSSNPKSEEQFQSIDDDSLQGEFRVELQSHPVAFGRNHLSLRVVPSDQSTYMNDPRFVRQEDETVAFTVGAGLVNVGKYPLS